MTNAAANDSASKDRRAAFVRLAEGRAAQAVNAVRLIGNLSNTSDYEFTQLDVDTIFKAVRDEIAAAESRFRAASQKIGRRPVKLAA